MKFAAVAAVACMIAIAFLGSTLITPLYALYRREFGFSEIVLTLIYAVYVVGNLGALLLFGRISDRVGRRSVALPALGAACASAAFFYFASSTGWLFVARLLSGLAVGVVSGSGTAWVAELYGTEHRTHATLLATCANLTGAAAGPLIGGLLAQYGPLPLKLPFILYVLALVAVAVAISRSPETVQDKRAVHLPDFRPRVGVPREIRAQFIAPAVTVFVAFALGGFFAALIPSIMMQNLHETNLAAGGAVVCELFGLPIPVILLTRKLESSTSMLAGLAALFPSLALLVLSQEERSMPLLLAATGVGGIALALGYRGSLQVVNQIAPADRRAEVMSAYYIACFVGNAVPVIGVGVIASLSKPLIASITFACALALLCAAGLFAGIRYRPSSASAEGAS